MKNDGFMNHYKVNSKFGEFKPVTNATLRKRIWEIRAMGAMDKVAGTKEFLDSFKESGQKTLAGAKSLITSPIETTQGAVSGVAKVFKGAADGIFGAKRSEVEDSKLKDVIGFSKVKREYAYQFSVDVYSRNKAIQDRLNDLAWAGYAGGMSLSVALMPVGGAAGVAISVSRLSETFNEIFRTTPPNELREQNAQKLLAMGTNPDIVDLYINNVVFTPREQTLLVLALNEMKGTKNRGAFVKFTVPTKDPDMAGFRQRQAEMYTGYHRSVEPIQEFVPFGNFVAARTRGNKIIVNVPLDHLVWTEVMAKLIVNANSLVDTMKWPSEKQIWVTGTISPTAVKEMTRRGWKVFQEKEKLLLGTKKAYPKYERSSAQPQ
ncbi:MAG: hypothetical protein GTO40_03060 [Deltaproteobacteria bacterium]|nr:hypothetical protein [Deltaproteobacteria bacterium]